MRRSTPVESLPDSTFFFSRGSSHQGGPIFRTQRAIGSSTRSFHDTTRDRASDISLSLSFARYSRQPFTFAWYPRNDETKDCLASSLARELISRYY